MGVFVRKCLGAFFQPAIVYKSKLFREITEYVQYQIAVYCSILAYLNLLSKQFTLVYYSIAG